jgi:NADH:ubiquinone oxidoreductase subunit F (NADH-binding)
MTTTYPSSVPSAGVAAGARLTLGWRETGRAASLREHIERFGHLPPGGPAARGLTARGQRQPSLADLVDEAGLTGRGGGGFPTGRKMRTVAAGRGPAVVVANGMESEPASEKDQALLAKAPHLVLDGIALAAQAVGADAAHLCLARTRRELTSSVLAALAERQRADVDAVSITVRELPHSYVSSEETSLVHWLNGGEAKPTSIPPRPFERGVRKRPTLIDNVETLAHVALIARHGPAWFRQAGLAGGAGTMLITVSGEVARPGVYEIEVGTRFADIMAMAGADTGSAALVGGYFGTWHDIADLADLPYSADGLRPAGGSPGAGVIWVLPSGSCGLAEAARILRYLASQGAQQCGPCIFGLPAIAEDLAQLASGRPEGEPLERMQRRLAQISGRGACRHPDGAVRMAASALSAFAADVHAHAGRRPCLACHRQHQQTAVLPTPPPLSEGEWR